jgi:hypothetical protein
MRKQFSDDQLDQLMRTLVDKASLDEGSISEIADSPSVWWGVHRKINEQKISQRSPWPPSVSLKRWLMIGFPSMAAAALLLAFFAMRAPVVPDDRTIVQDTNEPVIERSIPAAQPLDEVKGEIVPVAAGRITNARPTKVVGKTSRSVGQTTVAAVKSRTEIKTDFISLSYSGNPESGQVVRVKVPSSMMVSLGLVSSVERPTSLVDAEVVIGDDGQTHAIRFIR